MDRQITPKSVTYVIMATFTLDSEPQTLQGIGECVQEAIEKMQEYGEANVTDMKMFGE